MGEKDIVTKDYVGDCHVFADAFNQMIYGGEQVIRPEKLRSIETAVTGIPYGADDIKRKDAGERRRKCREVQNALRQRTEVWSRRMGRTKDIA